MAADVRCICEMRTGQRHLGRACHDMILFLYSPSILSISPLDYGKPTRDIFGYLNSRSSLTPALFKILLTMTYYINVTIQRSEGISMY